MYTTCHVLHPPCSPPVIAAPSLSPPVAGSARRRPVAQPQTLRRRRRGSTSRRRPARRWRRGCRTSASTPSRSRTTVDARAAVHEPGAEPGLRLQPRRSRPRVRRSRAARSRRCAMAYWGQALVLGPNINAPMDAGRRAEGAGARRRRRSRSRPRVDAARARLHRRAGRPLHRQARRPGAGGSRRTPTRCGRVVAARIPTTSTRGRCIAEALMDLRPWNYWTRDGVPYDETREIAGGARAGAGREHEPSGRAAPVDSPVGGDRHARARRSGGRSPAAADAGRRPHRPHAGAHLSARRPPRRCGRVEPARREGRRGLHRAVPRAGHVSARPTTRTTCTSSGWAPRRAASSTLALDSARKLAGAIPHEALGTRADPAGLPRRAVLGDGAVRASGTRSSPTRAPRHDTPFTRRRLALRAGDGAASPRTGSTRRSASWRS